MISFELTEEQEKTLNEWKAAQEFPSATIGGAYTYKFTPTGLGTVIVVRCVNGNKIDLTDYDNW